MADSTVPSIPFLREDLERPTPLRFERMVEAFPGRVALQASGRAVTYDALNRQANRIAHGLLSARGEGSNGKIDRAALPAVQRARGDAAGPSVAPRTPVEEALHRIWSRALGIPHLSVEDHFLHLGGNSLIAAAIVSGAQHAFRVAVPVRALLEAATVARMAAVVTQHLAERAGPVHVTRMLDTLDAPRDRPDARHGPDSTR